MTMCAQPILSRHTPPADGALLELQHAKDTSCHGSISMWNLWPLPSQHWTDSKERLRSRRHRYTKRLSASCRQTSKSVFLVTRYHHPYGNWCRSLVSLRPLQTPSLLPECHSEVSPWLVDSEASPGLPHEVPYEQGDTNEVCVSTSF